MQIKITPRTLGGTEFTAQPARLHLGAQSAEGVDRLVFQLPAEWAGCSVTLHIRHSDGTLAAPLVLDAAHSAPVGRSFTGWPAGQWMLAAANAAERAALNGSRAATSASRAESAALRAESFAPEDGTLLSVNGKGGAVVLDAQDVGALPAPVAPQAGALLRVLSIRSDGSLVVDTVTPAALKTLLEAT